MFNLVNKMRFRQTQIIIIISSTPDLTIYYYKVRLISLSNMAVVSIDFPKIVLYKILKSFPLFFDTSISLLENANQQIVLIG